MEKAHAHIAAPVRYDAVILADGDFPTHPLPLSLLHAAPLLCCCDGAGQRLIEQGITPHAIVGDGDSLPTAFKEQYAHLLHIVSEQEYNDLTKTTRFVLQHLPPSPSEADLPTIGYLACTGKREDHTLGNISLLAYYQREFRIQPVMYTDYGFFTPAIGTHTFRCFPRQQVSIFRLNATTLSSEGLRWQAYPYQEWWQGTLNEALSDTFTIHADGQYIIYQTYDPKTPPCPQETGGKD